MKIIRTIPFLALLALAGILAAAAPAAASTHASLLIRHQLHGCHAWAVNGGAFRATQSVTIRAGGSISITNNDVMPHKLVELSGQAVVYTRLKAGAGGLKGTFPAAMLAHVGASIKVTFAKPGVYRFTTKVGEDYMAGVKTIGEDNVLRLTVHVT